MKFSDVQAILNEGVEHPTWFEKLTEEQQEQFIDRLIHAIADETTKRLNKGDETNETNN